MKSPTKVILGTFLPSGKPSETVFETTMPLANCQTAMIGWPSVTSVKS